MKYIIIVTVTIFLLACVLTTVTPIVSKEPYRRATLAHPPHSLQTGGAKPQEWKP